MDWIIGGSKGIGLEFARVCMYLLCGGSVGMLCMSVLHVLEGLEVDAMDREVSWIQSVDGIFLNFG